MDAIRRHYSGFTLTVHWLTVVMVLAQVAIVWISKDFDRPVRGDWMMVHKSIGLTILMVTLARLAVRTKHPALPLPEQTPGWQKFAARGTHVLFYVLLIAMPLGGWIASTAAGRPVEFFFLFTWPDLPFVPASRDLAKGVMEVHEWAGWAMITLIGLHVLGGLKHYLVDKDNVLQRMLPFLPPRNGAA